MADSSSQVSTESSLYNVPYQSSPEDMEVEQNGEEEKQLGTKEIRKLIAPHYKERLFYRILYAKNVEAVAESCLLDYLTNSEKVINEIIQLFVDLSGYQLVNVENFINDGNEITNLVKYLERKETQLANTGKYFFVFSCKNDKRQQEKIEIFFQTWIKICAKDRILFDFNLLPKISTILIQMAASEFIVLTHTAVWIGLKIQTAILILITKIIGKIQKYNQVRKSASDDETRSSIKLKISGKEIIYEKLNNTFQLYHDKLFMPNCNFFDPKMYQVRLECLSELKKWIEIYSNRFLQNTYLDIIIKLLQDKNREVYIEAAKMLCELVEKYNKSTEQVNFNKIITPLDKGVLNRDIKIAICAVESLTRISRFLHMPFVVQKNIYKYIYHREYPLGAACGRYLFAKMLHTVKDSENKDQDLLKSLIQFSFGSESNGLVDKLPLLIEAVFDPLRPTLTNVKAYLDFLKTMKSTEKVIKMCVDILTESMHEMFIGCASITRREPRVSIVANSELYPLFQELQESMVEFATLVPMNELNKLMIILLEWRKHVGNSAAQKTRKPVEISAEEK